MGTITLRADARYGFGGKQYVARITGRDAKFTFQREFLGRKEGKRGERTEVLVDDPGLYEARDIDSKGRTDDRYIIFDGEHEVTISREDAMALARQIGEGNGDVRPALRRELVPILEAKIRESEARDQAEVITLGPPIGRLAPGSMVTRADIVAERRRLLAELRGDIPEPTHDDRAARVDKVRALMTELGVTLADLAE